MISNEILIPILIGFCAGYVYRFLDSKQRQKPQAEAEFPAALVNVSKLALLEIYKENKNLGADEQPINKILTNVNFEQHNLKVRVFIEVME